MRLSSYPSKRNLRVGFYGNNLNLAFNVVAFLTRLGFHCTWIGFTNSSQNPQDDPPWQGCSLDSLRHRVVLGHDSLFNPFSRDYPLIKQKINAACSELDVLFLSEDGPCWFLDQHIPKYFISQGGDLQDFPFFFQRTLVHFPHLITSFFSSLSFSASRCSYSTNSPNQNIRLNLKSLFSVAVKLFIAKSCRQYYQRRGLRLCEKVFITPNQQSIVRTLRIPDSKVNYLPLPTFAKYTSKPDRLDLNSSLETVRKLSLSRLILFSPSRILLPSSAKPYAKYNHFLLHALSSFSTQDLSRIILVLVRKGSSRDLAKFDDMINHLGLSNSVVWIPPQPAYLLSSFYKLDNLVVCDQFSDNIAYLGAIGRESSLHGKLILTAFSQWNSLYYGSDMPPHVYSCFSSEDIAYSIQSILSLEPAKIACISSLAKRWYHRWHSPSASLRRFILSCFPES